MGIFSSIFGGNSTPAASTGIKVDLTSDQGYRETYEVEPGTTVNEFLSEQFANFNPANYNIKLISAAGVKSSVSGDKVLEAGDHLSAVIPKNTAGAY